MPPSSLPVESLVSLTLELYESFLPTFDPAADPSSNVGNAFYEYQVQSPLPRSPEFKALREVSAEAFEDTTLTFLNRPLTASERDNIFCWAAVGGGGGAAVPFHPPHTHRNSLLSSTYYARVGEGAGPITLYDPRGVFPNGHHIHHPEANTLIVFPSWLKHMVAPSGGAEYRVSFACNLPGTWEETAEVNLEL